MAESEEELKNLLLKEESERADLKFNIQKTKIMASGPIISWQIEREKIEAVTDFLSLGSKITVDGDCSMKLKDACLLLAMTNLDSILKSKDGGPSPSDWAPLQKSKDITMSTKVHIVKAMVFPVAMYRCERWTIK